LVKDIRNNSAWNQRWFALHHGAKPSQSQTQLSQEIIERELSFVFTSLDKASKNESAWNYLRGLLRYYGPAYGGLVQRRAVER
jgi:protein farnesyltransferase/geranylgeranyltransferase type-1 subunit alpha